MAFRILLSGTGITEYLVPITEHSDLEGTDITYSRNTTDSNLADIPEKSFSGAIHFYSATLAIIKTALYENNPLGSNQIVIKIFDDCCSKLSNPKILFTGKATRLDVSFCAYENSIATECSLSIQFKELSDFISRYQCLMTSLIGNDNPYNGLTFHNANNKHPMIRYCKEIRPRIIQDIWMGIYAASSFSINSLLPFFYPVFFIIELFIIVYNAVAPLVGLNQIDLDSGVPGAQTLLDVILTTLTDIGVWVTGCGKGHMAPFVREFIKNGCNKCGIKFDDSSDSIFNHPDSEYYYTAYLSSINQEGDIKYNKANEIYWQNNRPIKSTYEFLNDLAKPFNAIWDIVYQNGQSVLIFKKKSPAVPHVVIDLTVQETKARIVSLCFEYSDKRTPAMLKLGYADDPQDISANECHVRYDDLIDYQNNPTTQIDLVGLREELFTFSMAKYRKDNLGRDVLTSWLEPNLDNPFSYLLLINIINIVFQNTPDFENNDRWLTLCNGVTHHPKLITLVPDYNPNNALTERVPVFTNDPDYRADRYYYNMKMWFADIFSYNIATFKPIVLENLYRFWKTEDPRFNAGLVQSGITGTAELAYNCDEILLIIQQIKDFGFDIHIKTPYLNLVVDAKITSLTVAKNMLKISFYF